MKRSRAFLLGSGLAIWAFWIAATAIGASVGDVVGDPASYGLDFALPAVFLTFAVGLWDGRESMLPWGVAAAVAISGAALLPGRWYILLDGLAASLTEVSRRVL